jgi:hypothetical protein
MTQFEPLSDEPGLMSEDKRLFWSKEWTNPGGIMTPNLALFQYAMNGTLRPTNPRETIAMGYTRGSKFHDREPEAVVKAMLVLNPAFFNSYPRKEGTPVDMQLMKAAVGEAARAFYRHGLSAYGKPGLRKQEPPPAVGTPTVVI